jgi:hypothetical protein
METREWKTLNRTGWPSGEWDDEPDKAQWIDEGSGLPCLAVRASHSGHWCGYVGVSESHPWFGKGYDDCVLKTALPRGPKDGDEKWGSFAKDLAERTVCDEEYCSHRPESMIEVHGGLTFADSCMDTSEEAWGRWRQRMADRAEDAKKYPRGDSARTLRDWGAGIDSYDAWRELAQARAICHTPGPGEPDHAWWFGFDCAHSGDASPARGDDFGLYGSYYKTLSYVRNECAKLARQLADREKRRG